MNEQQLFILQMPKEGYAILQRLLTKVNNLDFNEAKQVLEFVNIFGGQGLISSEEYQKELIGKYEEQAQVEPLQPQK